MNYKKKYLKYKLKYLAAKKIYGGMDGSSRRDRSPLRSDQPSRERDREYEFEQNQSEQRNYLRHLHTYQNRLLNRDHINHGHLNELHLLASRITSSIIELNQTIYNRLNESVAGPSSQAHPTDDYGHDPVLGDESPGLNALAEVTIPAAIAGQEQVFDEGDDDAEFDDVIIAAPADPAAMAPEAAPAAPAAMAAEEEEQAEYNPNPLSDITTNIYSRKKSRYNRKGKIAGSPYKSRTFERAISYNWQYGPRLNFSPGFSGLTQWHPSQDRPPMYRVNVTGHVGQGKTKTMGIAISDNIREALLIYILAIRILKGRGHLPTPAQKGAALANRERAAANSAIRPTPRQVDIINDQIYKSYEL